MSGNVVTSNPLMPSVGPFNYGNGLIVAYDFANVLATGESISPSVTLPPSIPSGFTRTLVSVSGAIVTVYEVAPQQPGNYVLPVPITITGGAISPRPYTRSARTVVLQL